MDEGRQGHHSKAVEQMRAFSDVAPEQIQPFVSSIASFGERMIY
jgi:hypothetical protein